MGRPTKYKPEYIEEVDRYLKECKVQERGFVSMSGPKGDAYQRVVDVKMPSIVGFALFIDVPLKTVERWYYGTDIEGDEEKDYPEIERFRGSLSRVVELQHQWLLEHGLNQDFNPKIAELMLMTNHGYARKQENDNKNQDVPTEINIT